MASVSDEDALVQRIHNASTRIVLTATGGGSRAISALLTMPGASRSIIEATVPYAPEALKAYLGAAPEQSCSSRTARAMAMAAYCRGVTFAPVSEADAQRLAGVACTASLASDRPKRGAHRLHVAWQTATTTAVVNLELEKGRRTRAEEERLASRMVLNAVAEACGLSERLTLGLAATEPFAEQRSTAPKAWQDLLAGRVQAVCLGPTLQTSNNAPAIFPGAFDPRHDAHRRMAQLAAEQLGVPVACELSIVNVDKPPLDFVEIAERAAQFGAEETLWLTRAATFVEKSELFPGATFVVGADTLVRIADPRYYGGAPDRMEAAFETIRKRGCRFLVFGRVSEQGLKTLGSFSLPASLAELCDEVPADVFRHDVSSTKIRRQRDQHGS